MRLPYQEHLPVEKLAAVFNNTTNSYKYYWFLSLLEFVKEDSNTTISIDSLVLDMIGSAWFPINYYKLSFGKQDQLSNFILELQISYGYPISIKKHELIRSLLKSKEDQSVKKIIDNLSRYVPYRFISPWYSDSIRGIPDNKKNDLIYTLSNQQFTDEYSPSIYRIVGDSIEMNKIWKQYLLKHYTVLQGFTYWHLISYLHRNNPNVPSISEKLSPPEFRFLKTARFFWDTYFEKKGIIRCIYSDQKLLINDYSIDHFIPWSFVTHDQLWNLIPAPKNINSSKGNYLPSTFYLDRFAEIQYDAFHTTRLVLKEKILEDYSILFNNSISEIAKFDKRTFTEAILQNIKPLIQIATNMGFSPNWTWR
jgi:hypothetical protein